MSTFNKHVWANLPSFATLFSGKTPKKIFSTDIFDTDDRRYELDFVPWRNAEGSPCITLYINRTNSRKRYFPVEITKNTGKAVGPGGINGGFSCGAIAGKPFKTLARVVEAAITDYNFVTRTR